MDFFLTSKIVLSGFIYEVLAIAIRIGGGINNINLLTYLPTPSLGQDMTQGQFFLSRV